MHLLYYFICVFLSDAKKRNLHCAALQFSRALNNIRVANIIHYVTITIMREASPLATIVLMFPRATL